MNLTLDQIDRAIEWAIRDEVVRLGYWPDLRAALISGDEAAYQAAVAAMNPKIEVFGSGNYQDRSDQKKNNVIIERRDVEPGEIGFSYPFEIKRQPDFSFQLLRTPDGSYHIPYEIRFVCDTVALDRVISTIMINTFGHKLYLNGLNGDMTESDLGFTIVQDGDPVDMSDTNFIERVYLFSVRDVFIGDDKLISTSQMVTEISIYSNLPTDEDSKLYPLDENDVAPPAVYNGGDYFKYLAEQCAGYKLMDRIAIYATQDEATALKPILRGLSGINHGLAFTPWTGYQKATVNDYIDTKFDRTLARNWQNECCSFTFFLSGSVNGNLVIAGITDGTTDFEVRGTNAGMFVKGNSNAERQFSNLNFSPLKVYVINKPSSKVLELWEDAVLIGKFVNEVPIHAAGGDIYELNINDGAHASGDVIAFKLGFTSYGFGMRPTQIRDWSAAVKGYFSKLGYFD